MKAEPRFQLRASGRYFSRVLCILGGRGSFNSRPPIAIRGPIRTDLNQGGVDFPGKDRGTGSPSALCLDNLVITVMEYS